MAFSAGGTNVTGVKQIEQGQLKLLQQTLAISADGTFQIDTAIPAGRLYNLKSWNIFQSGGTFSLSTLRMILNDGTTSMSISATNTNNTINMEIPNGFTLRQQFTITGFTLAGNVVVQMLVQEIDV